ncbi:yjeF C-terminal region, hydroxyethylthiazole kinase-related/yjeF N-terminal region [Bosea sp. OK403]|uniref:NAD(P)H-hydrate dehydratase n=1 Tax=Bosea sp. OK403 TaxID=1855286 RepID=UPI0008EA1C37|nr:yjeF C-terminal region, hydroxyethylthiazole kinase-related/yjeF N-terminal region [Bosea sp. OK403]
MDRADKTGLALLSVADMAAADRATIAAGTPGLALMERAGRAVADAVSRRARPGNGVLVLCGPGNNGGDGFVAARLLRERGFDVTVALAGKRSALTGDAATMAARWTGAIAPIAAIVPHDHALIVDALYGAGLNRPLAGDVAGLVAAVNAADRPVIAVDVPSGLPGDSGRPEGVVVQADETVTFFRLKPGHLLEPGRGLCGVVTLAQIGLSPETVFGVGGLKPAMFRNGPALWRELWPRHQRDTHKYRRGAVLIVAGGLSGVGAPRLGARAALRIGAGLVTVACRPEALAAHAARGPDALMQRPIPTEAALQGLLDDERLGAVLIGPALGLDAEARAAVMAVLRADIPAVFDADALTLLASRPGWLRQRAKPCVLTPHEGEFARLFGDDERIVAQASKLERAKLAAAASGAVVVLKGSDTVIADPDGRAAINATGSWALATAGAGDVLGGLIAGLLAQGMPAFEAACAAVWLHGKAGEALGPGLIADDLPEAIPSLVAPALADDDA